MNSDKDWFDEKAKYLSDILSNSDDFKPKVKIKSFFDFNTFKTKNNFKIDKLDDSTQTILLNKLYNNDLTNVFNNLYSDFHFDNVLSNLKTSNINFDFTINKENNTNNDFNKLINTTETNNNNTCICTHKFKINFSKKQHKILQSYFKESIDLYNFCIDIFEKYPELNVNWMFLKTIIFNNTYKLNIIDNTEKIKVSDTISNIILKDKQKIHDIITNNNKKKDEIKEEPIDLITKIINIIKKDKDDIKKIILNKKLDIDKEKKRINDKFTNDLLEFKNRKINGSNIIKKENIPKKENLNISKFIAEDRSKEKDKKEKVKRDDFIKKPAPKDTLYVEIQEFCTNLKNTREKIKKINEKKLNKKKYKDKDKDKNTDTNTDIDKKNILKRKKYDDKILTITLTPSTISEKGICNRELGKLNCTNFIKYFKKYANNNNIENVYNSRPTVFDKYDILNNKNNTQKVNKKTNLKLVRECKLQYDTILKKYYLLVVFDRKKNAKLLREKFVACDPGEKNFLSIYSNKKIANLGTNMREKILAYKKQISKLQSKVNKKKKNKKKIQKHLIKTMRCLEKKIKNYANEIHKKSARYLCLNFENILIPKFGTKNMISNKIKVEKNEKINKLPDGEEKKQKRKEFRKENKLSKKIKYVLQHQSHYRFREYLMHYAKRYRSTVLIVDESYTSVCCTNCGTQSNNYDSKRIKECINCKKKIDRDENGSRNIFIKTLKDITFGANQINLNDRQENN